MIWKLAQTEAGFSNSYVFYDGEGAVAGAKQPNNIVLGGTVFYTHTDGRVYRLGYQAGGQIGNLKKAPTERGYLPYDILGENGENYGRIEYRYSKGNIFKRYDYFWARLGTTEYQLYSVGLGKKGYEYPIYSGDLQIALIEKGNIVRDQKDNYDLYIASESDTLITALFALYMDTLIYGNRGKQVSQSYSESWTVTTNKELKSKYDPSFKERILAADGRR